MRSLKGLPLPAGVSLADIGGLGWNALTDLETPVLLLHADAMQHNIETMDRYVRDAGVLLAPHSKTTLSRQVVEAQLRGGAWGMTAATIGQVRSLHSWEVRRIVLANVLTDPVAIRWLADTLLTDDCETELWCYVDSVAGVELLDRALTEASAARPLRVLLERGYAGGRTGARTREEGLAVATAARASTRLVLSGVAGYEGLMHHDPRAEHPPGLVPFLDQIGASARDLVEHDLLEVDEPLVTAGGSSYFDLVCARLGPAAVGAPYRTVLRSGCYVTHDHGMYQRTSPFDGRRASADAPRFRPALELLARVLSTPEPGLAIVDLGRRDVPIDDQLPVLLGRYEDGGLTPVSPGEQLLVEKVNDQHGYLRTPDGPALAVGDLLSFGISHPCGAFDRWRAIPRIAPNRDVLDVVTTQL